MNTGAVYVQFFRRDRAKAYRSVFRRWPLEGSGIAMKIGACPWHVFVFYFLLGQMNPFKSTRMLNVPENFFLSVQQLICHVLAQCRDQVQMQDFSISQSKHIAADSERQWSLACCRPAAQSHGIDCLPTWWRKASCHRKKLQEAEGRRHLLLSESAQATVCVVLPNHCLKSQSNKKNNLILLPSWQNRQKLTQLYVHFGDLIDKLSLFYAHRLQCEAPTRCDAVLH